MRTTQIGKHKVEVYDSIDALPVLRFHAFNKMMLVDSGIGSDLNDWDAHAERVIRFIMSDDKDASLSYKFKGSAFCRSSCPDGSRP